MTGRLIKIIAKPDTVQLQVREKRKTELGTTLVTSQWFYITRNELKRILSGTGAVTSDMYSFAKFYPDPKHDRLEIRFSWLTDGPRETLTGYRQTVYLPLARFLDFIGRPIGNDAIQTVLPDVGKYVTKPHIMFLSDANLANVLRNRKFRKKLSHSLEREFEWPEMDEIRLYDDFDPFSFTFKAFRDGKARISGGLILHISSDPKRTQYFMHT